MWIQCKEGYLKELLQRGKEMNLVISISKKEYIPIYKEVTNKRIPSSKQTKDNSDYHLTSFRNKRGEYKLDAVKYEVQSYQPLGFLELGHKGWYLLYINEEVEKQYLDGLKIRDIDTIIVTKDEAINNQVSHHETYVFFDGEREISSNFMQHFKIEKS